MITIIPALEVMKAVTDNNIKSERGELRRKAFDEATNLQSMQETELQVVINP